MHQLSLCIQDKTIGVAPELDDNALPELEGFVSSTGVCKHKTESITGRSTKTDDLSD